MTYLIKTISDV